MKQQWGLYHYYFSNIIIIIVVIMGLYGVGAPFGLSLDTPLSIRYGVYVNVYLIVWPTIVLPSSWFPVSPVGSLVYKIKACTQTGSWWTNGVWDLLVLNWYSFFFYLLPCFNVVVNLNQLRRHLITRKFHLYKNNTSKLFTHYLKINHTGKILYIIYYIKNLKWKNPT